MLKLKSSRLAVAVVISTVLILAAGGAAVASNMAFKLNRPLSPNPAGGPVNESKHWTSIPYFNPYTTNCTTGAGVSCAGAFCQATGLPPLAAGQLPTNITVRQAPPLSGFSTVACPLPTATTGASFGLALQPGQGIQIHMPSGYPGGSIIIVGSHNPALSLTVQDAPAFKNWVSIPYHTTAVSSRDFCVQSGLSLGPGPAATITRQNPATGAFSSVSCSVNPGLTLILGEALEVTEPNGPKTFVPAHF